MVACDLRSGNRINPSFEQILGLPNWHFMDSRRHVLQIVSLMAESTYQDTIGTDAGKINMYPLRYQVTMPNAIRGNTIAMMHKFVRNVERNDQSKSMYYK